MLFMMNWQRLAIIKEQKDKINDLKIERCAFAHLSLSKNVENFLKIITLIWQKTRNAFGIIWGVVYCNMQDYNDICNLLNIGGGT